MELTQQERNFILRAIWNISILYDFDLSEQEFEKSYDLTKKEVVNFSVTLSDKIRGLK